MGDHAALSEWHPSRNGKLQPDSVPAESRKPVWWRCPQGPEWVTSPDERVRRGNHRRGWCTSK
ncbi:zinc-ribbon domain-containing protein [uncultured Aeromicrobium sp.]|uniref:zinc-ribbon domain-containing protein n=1 Tax=uncultured Aeromicrobium sp. TaxID=337820 RepID=UPI003415EB81